MREELIIEHVRKLLVLCSLKNTINYTGQIDNTLTELGIQHGIGAWCYYRYKQGVLVLNKNTALERWKKLYLVTSIQNQHKLRVFNEIQQLLKNENITTVALKGTALANHLYPDEGLRPMGDLDILVPEGDGIKALNTLLKAGAKMGYVPRSALHEQVHSHIRTILFKDVLIEIHQRLFSKGNPFYISTNDCYDHLINISKKEIDIFILNNLYTAYHLIAHAASNIESGGLRLSWLVDIALLLLKQDNPAKFINQVLQLNLKTKNKLLTVLKMTALLLPPQIQQSLLKETQIVNSEEELYYWMKKRDIKQIHKIVNLKEIIHTPGLKNKATLLLREFFPTREYMLQWGKGKENRLWRLHIKRLLKL
jgi:hypothetical protein